MRAWRPALLAAALTLTACGQTGTASFGGYVPPVPAAPAAGQISVTVHAPQGVTPALALRAPDTTTQAIATPGLHRFTDLTPGVYVLTGGNVRVDGFTFAPNFTGNPLTVQADTTAEGSVQYVPLGGRLAVNVQTAGGLTPNVRVTGPGSFTRTVTTSGTTVLTDLNAGAYTVTATPRLFNGRTYAPTVLTGGADVQAGVTRSVGVTYAAPTTSLDVRVLGLSGDRAQVHLSGMGVNLSLQDATTLSGLAPGDYTLRADVVTSTAGTFTPDLDTQALTLTAGQALTATVTYR